MEFIEKNEVDMRLIFHLADGGLRARKGLHGEFVMMPELIDQRFAKKLVVINK